MTCFYGALLGFWLGFFAAATLRVPVREIPLRNQPDFYVDIWRRNDPNR